jgi:hypothetical protein
MLILPDFVHHIIWKVAFFKELDGVRHVASLDCNLIFDTVAFYFMTSPERNDDKFTCFLIYLMFC